MTTVVNRLETTSASLKSGRLKNGVGAGSIARVYRGHELRFARVEYVFSRAGIGPNVKLHYLDYGQEEATVYGSVVQPVTKGWIVDMKERFGRVQQMFQPSLNGPAAVQSEPGPRKLKSGATEGSLVRIYREHHLRFARLIAIDKVGIPTMPNVSIEYLDSEEGEDRKDKVFGNIVQPFTQEWIENLEARLDALSKLMAAERAMELREQSN